MDSFNIMGEEGAKFISNYLDRIIKKAKKKEVLVKNEIIMYSMIIDKYGFENTLPSLFELINIMNEFKHVVYDLCKNEETDVIENGDCFLATVKDFKVLTEEYYKALCNMDQYFKNYFNKVIAEENPKLKKALDSFVESVEKSIKAKDN